MKLPASIPKIRINPVYAATGKANDAPLTIDGQAFAAGTLRLANFIGRLNLATKLYDGHFLFEPQTGPIESHFSVSALIHGDEQGGEE